MKDDIFLSVIIPAYNEAKRLPSSITKCVSFLSEQDFNSEILIVENGSTDYTLQIAKDVANDISCNKVQIRVIGESGRGKGRAVQRGLLDAHGEYCFMADADLSMPIEQVSRFLPPSLSNFDIAIGSREAEGSVRYNEPLYRHLGGRVMNTIIRLLALPELHDTQCGFKCFRAPVAKHLFSLQTQMGWAFDVEILYLAKYFHYHVVEVAIDWYFNAESKLNLVKDTWQMIRDIYTIRKSLEKKFDYN